MQGKGGKGGDRHSEVGGKTLPGPGVLPRSAPFLVSGCHVLWVKVSSGSVSGRRATMPSHLPHRHTLEDGTTLGARGPSSSFPCTGEEGWSSDSPGQEPSALAQLWGWPVRWKGRSEREQIRTLCLWMFSVSPLRPFRTLDFVLLPEWPWKMLVDPKSLHNL